MEWAVWSPKSNSLRRKIVQPKILNLWKSTMREKEILSHRSSRSWPRMKMLPITRLIIFLSRCEKMPKTLTMKVKLPMLSKIVWMGQSLSTITVLSVTRLIRTHSRRSVRSSKHLIIMRWEYC